MLGGGELTDCSDSMIEMCCEAYGDKNTCALPVFSKPGTPTKEYINAMLELIKTLETIFREPTKQDDDPARKLKMRYNLTEVIVGPIAVAYGLTCDVPADVLKTLDELKTLVRPERVPERVNTYVLIENPPTCTGVP